MFRHEIGETMFLTASQVQLLPIPGGSEIEIEMSVRLEYCPHFNFGKVSVSSAVWYVDGHDTGDRDHDLDVGADKAGWA